MKDICMVYITASGREEAEKIAGELVSTRLAACANIYNNVLSVYNWENKLERGEEATLFVKTKLSLVPEIKEKVGAMHSYKCPCILTVPIIDANDVFADWVRSETK